jgi:hypothetical protein
MATSGVKSIRQSIVTRRLHMQKIMLFLSVLLLGIPWAVAQDASSQSSPTAASSGQAAQSGGQMMVQGCLGGSDGNYTLSDSNGTVYQLTGDTAKLSAHVGHEVKVTGTSDSSAAGTGTPSGSGATTGHSIQVSSVKHISKSCKMGGASPKY